MTVEFMGINIPSDHFDYSRHGTIISKEILAEQVRQHDVYAPLIARKAKPGQFVILRLTEAGEGAFLSRSWTTTRSAVRLR